MTKERNKYKFMSDEEASKIEDTVMSLKTVLRNIKDFVNLASAQGYAHEAVEIIDKLQYSNHNIVDEWEYKKRIWAHEGYSKELKPDPDKNKSHISPSGNYMLITRSYKTGENTWSYTSGTVIDLDTSKEIHHIQRNYSSFWFEWVEHSNGNEYLLCGEDYQGYICINLTKNEKHAFFPKCGLVGTGFCWSNVYLSPDKKKLCVSGCYWAAPYELIIYNFSNPDKLPYKELHRGWDDHFNDFHVTGWKDNETLLLKGSEVEYRKSDGKLCRFLPIEERDRLNDQLIEVYNKQYEKEKDMAEIIEKEKKETKEEKEERQKGYELGFRPLTGELKIDTLDHKEDESCWDKITIYGENGEIRDELELQGDTS